MLYAPTILNHPTVIIHIWKCHYSAVWPINFSTYLLLCNKLSQNAVSENNGGCFMHSSAIWGSVTVPLTSSVWRCWGPECDPLRNPHSSLTCAAADAGYEVTPQLGLALRCGHASLRGDLGSLTALRLGSDGDRLTIPSKEPSESSSILDSLASGSLGVSSAAFYTLKHLQTAFGYKRKGDKLHFLGERMVRCWKRTYRW